jgi:type II secretory pathway pseudopilin PulG
VKTASLGSFTLVAVHIFNAIRSRKARQTQSGFTLEEVVVAMALTALCFGATIKGYMMASERAEWSACALAAQSAAFQRLEQTRGPKWDTMGNPPVDELVATNFPVLVQHLDMPLTSTNAVSARVTTTIATITADPPLRSVQVDCVWTNRGKAFTNTVIGYRTPSQ